MGIAELKSHLLKEIERVNKLLREMENIAKEAGLNCKQDQLFAFYAGYKKALEDVLGAVWA